MDLESIKKSLDHQKPRPSVGYMEGLESRVIERYLSRNKKKSTRRLWPYIAAAASIAALMWVALPEQNASISSLGEEQLAYHYVQTEQSIDWWEDEWLEEIEMDELVTLLEEDLADDEIFDLLYKNLEL